MFAPPVTYPWTIGEQATAVTWGRWALSRLGRVMVPSRRQHPAGQRRPAIGAAAKSLRGPVVAATLDVLLVVSAALAPFSEPSVPSL